MTLYMIIGGCVILAAFLFLAFKLKSSSDDEAAVAMENLQAIKEVYSVKTSASQAANDEPAATLSEPPVKERLNKAEAQPAEKAAAQSPVQQYVIRQNMKTEDKPVDDPKPVADAPKPVEVKPDISAEPIQAEPIQAAEPAVAVKPAEPSELEISLEKLKTAELKIAELAKEKKNLEDALKRELDAKPAENEKLVLSEEAAKLRERYDQQVENFRNLSAELTKLKEGFEYIRQEDRQKLDQLKEELTKLQADNKTLINQLDLSYKQVEQLKKKAEDVYELKQQYLEKQTTSATAVNALREEREELIAAKEELTEKVATLKDYNTYLLEKEKVLQYELTKNRAQALGLEKICEDFKIQMDETSRIRS